MSGKNIVAVIAGSSFSSQAIKAGKVTLQTPFGEQVLYRLENEVNTGYLIYRHGLPHQFLPNQIKYRAQAWALKELGCNSLLLTSSVGVLDPDLPLYKPILLSDILMLDNRLPDGSACTMFVSPTENHGHLVLREGLFSKALGEQIVSLAAGQAEIIRSHVVFGYYGGPRTKTSAENEMFRRLGAHVNSMSLAPEAVLANELEIPCAGIVVGHKYSLPDSIKPEEELADVDETLTKARESLSLVIERFLKSSTAVHFANEMFRFERH